MQRIANVGVAILPPMKANLAKTLGEAKSEALTQARQGQDGYVSFRGELHRLLSRPDLSCVLDVVMPIVDSNN